MYRVENSNLLIPFLRVSFLKYERPFTKGLSAVLKAKKVNMPVQHVALSSFTSQKFQTWFWEKSRQFIQGNTLTVSKGNQIPDDFVVWFVQEYYNSFLIWQILVATLLTSVGVQLPLLPATFPLLFVIILTLYQHVIWSGGKLVTASNFSH